MAQQNRRHGGLPLIVGIGASSGGREALVRLFSATASEAGKALEAAFVIVPHGDDRALQDILESLQAFPWPVEMAETGREIRSGVVYLSPTRTQLSLKGGVFEASPAPTSEEHSSAIDAFFRSLAGGQGQNAIGILLSGDGTDGSQGLREIGQAGGLCIVQTPLSAVDSSMLRSAIDLGVVDYILPPEEIIGELASYGRYLRSQGERPAEQSLKEEIGSAIVSICETLYKKSKHDFKHYKTSTLVRRIQRRMQVLKLRTVEDYLERLQSEASEADRLFSELLINVTSFFRDKESFETLQKDVLPAIVANHVGGEKIRVWVAGCSTGEEAYSFAILFRELLEGVENAPEVQIIATDVDELALGAARRGSYPISISEHVSPERLRKYFLKKGGRYHVRKEIRELCLFSAHSLVTDPPFSQLDLISCRNVLIYLGAHLQKKLIPVFHYALRPGGYLFLGSSESLTGHAELFRAVSVKHRIGQRKQTAVRASTSFPMSFRPGYTGHFSEAPQAKEADIHEVSQRIILDEFAPKYVVINDEQQIVSVSSGMKIYLEPSAGSFQNHLLKLVRPELRLALRTILIEGQKNKRKVSNNSSVIHLGKEYHRVGLTVQPMPQLGGESELFMIVFRDLGKVAESAASEGDSAQIDAAFVEQLENELAMARTDLEKSVQDLEAVNEEIKSSNEELLSMNEELQSANEELESSKEEIQIANSALLRANSDLENLLASTQIATLFLDENLKILNFTPHLSRIYNLIARDRGRLITDITHNVVSMPAFPSFQALKGRSDWVEDEIVTRDGHHYLRRISVYRNHEREQSGMVVNFIDVTELRESETLFAALTETMSQMVWATDPDGRRLYFNQRWCDYTGLSETESMALGFSTVIHPDDHEAASRLWSESLRTGKPFGTQYRLKSKEGVYRWQLVRALPLRDGEGRLVKWFGTSTDIHEQKELEERLRRQAEELSEEKKRLGRVAEAISLGVWFSDLPFQGKELLWNDNVKEHYWFKRGERVLMETAMERIHPEDREGVRKAVLRSIEEHLPYEASFRTVNPENPSQFKWIKALGWTDVNADGKAVRFDGVTLDETDAKLAEQRLARSEEFHKYAIRASRDVIWDWDLLTDRVRWNEAICSEMGYPASAMDSDANSWILAIHPGDRDRVAKGIHAAIEAAEPHWSERYRYRRYDSSYAWVQDHGYIIKNESGRAVRMIGAMEDVTAQVEQQALLKQSEQQFRLLANTMAQLAWKADPEGSVTWTNQRWTDYTGANQKELLGWGWLRFVEAEKAAEISAEWRNCVRQGIPFEGEFRIQAASGENRWFLTRSVPVRNEEGRTIRWFGTSTDITETKRFQDELHAAKDSAEAANRAKSEFLANMSHEIRTPLAAIVGFSELLQGSGSMGGEGAEFLSRIQRNARQLTHLIDEILDLSKIEANRLDVELTAVDLKAALEDAFSTGAFKAREKGLDFQQIWHGEAPSLIVTDSMRFRQILINLLGNAVKFTERGKVEIHLRTRGWDGSSVLDVEVRDTGIGLSAEQQERIFEPFMQADGSINRKYGGTGLGLALSRKLARGLGGDLVLKESRLGQGSSFVLTLPYRLPDEGEKRSAGASAQEGDGGSDLSGFRILIVDDAPDNQTLVSRYLSKVGAAFETADNGEVAVQKALGADFNLILMDVQMPVMDGIQALKTLKGRGYKKPIVALTAHALKSERERCLQAGFDEYLTKPIDRAELIRVIAHLLRKN